MASREVMEGDKVHHEGRKHPTKDGWLQANGEIVGVIMSDPEDDEPSEPYEVVVSFGEGDTELYFVEQLEWTDDLGGYWRVT